MSWRDPHGLQLRVYRVPSRYYGSLVIAESNVTPGDSKATLSRDDSIILFCARAQVHVSLMVCYLSSSKSISIRIESHDVLIPQLRFPSLVVPPLRKEQTVQKCWLHDL